MAKRKKKTVAVRWDGRGVRLLGKSDGLSQDYRWDGPGAVVEVAAADAEAVLTTPGALVAVDPDDLDAPETGALEPEGPGIAHGSIELRAPEPDGETKE